VEGLEGMEVDDMKFEAPSLCAQSIVACQWGNECFHTGRILNMFVSSSKLKT
jgi:hypothetical protein